MGYDRGVLFESLDDHFKKGLPSYPKWHKPVFRIISIVTLLVSIIKLLRS